MKKIILVTFISILTQIIYSQEIIDTYKMSFFDPITTYNIAASKFNDEKSTFYIYTFPIEKYTKNTLLIVRPNKLEDFKYFINDAKKIYEKWIETAKENKVTDLDKPMSIDRNLNLESTFYKNKWYFDYSVELLARFKIIEGNKYLLIIQNKSKLVSSLNKYIDSDGFYMIFSSTDEIELFLSKLTLENVNRFYEKKYNKEGLFKE